MTTTTFDTLGYFEKLKAAGVPEGQAKAQAETLRDIIEERLITKAHLDLRLPEIKADLIKWMVGLSVGQLAIVLAILAFIR